MQKNRKYCWVPQRCTDGGVAAGALPDRGERRRPGRRCVRLAGLVQGLVARLADARLAGSALRAVAVVRSLILLGSGRHGGFLQAAAISSDASLQH